MTNEEFAQAAAGYTPSLAEQKREQLAKASQEKKDRLGQNTYVKDTLLGMSDADSLRTKLLDSTRSSTTGDKRYDAVEILHGDNKYDMYGAPKSTRQAYQKSEYSMQKQREQVANIVGKSTADVTKQDMLDVGNMQQIQKLADIVRGKGEERWEAPLIRNSEQVNLTGKTTDEFGNALETPLNVPILSRATGEEFGDRKAASFGAVGTQINVTDEAAADPRMNAFAPQPVQVPKAGRLTNLAKGLGYSVSKLLYGLADTAVEIGGKVIGDTINYADANLGGDGKNTVGDWFNRADLWTEKQITEGAKEVSGYSDEYSKEAMDENDKILDTAMKRKMTKGGAAEYLAGVAEDTKKIPVLNLLTGIAANFAKMAEGVTADEVGTLVSNGLSTPETIIESSAEMVTMILGSKGAGLTKLGKKIDDIEVTTKDMKRAQTNTGKPVSADTIRKAKEKRLKAGATAQQRIAELAMKNSGIFAVSGNMVNQSNDEFEEKYGRSKTYDEIAGDLLATVLFNKLDTAVDVAVLKGTNGLASQLKEIMPAMTKPDMDKWANKFGAKAIDLFGAYGKEFGTELLQETQQGTLTLNIVGEDSDIAKGGDELDEASEETAKSGVGGAVMGGGSGVQMAAGGMAYRGAKDLISKVRDRKTTDEAHPIDEQAPTTADTVRTAVTNKDIPDTVNEETRNTILQYEDVLSKVTSEEDKQVLEDKYKGFLEDEGLEGLWSIPDAETMEYEAEEATETEQLKEDDELYTTLMGDGDVGEIEQRVGEYLQSKKGKPLTPEERLTAATVVDYIKRTKASTDGTIQGATPEEESAIMNAYFLMEDDAQAEGFRQATEKLDPDTKEAFAKASEAKTTYKELLEGLKTTRGQVVTEGLSVDKPGFMTSYREALFGEDKGAALSKLEQFTGSQTDKAKALETQRDDGKVYLKEYIKDIKAEIDSIARATGKDGSYVSEQTIMKALLMNEGKMPKVDDAQNTEYKKAESQVFMALGLDPKGKDENGDKITIPKITAEVEFKYASDKYNRIKEASTRERGNWQLEAHTLLPELAKEYGLNPTFRANAATGSGTTNTIEAINREVKAMQKALSLLKNEDTTPTGKPKTKEAKGTTNREDIPITGIDEQSEYKTAKEEGGKSLPSKDIEIGESTPDTKIVGEGLNTIISIDYNDTEDNARNTLNEAITKYKDAIVAIDQGETIYSIKALESMRADLVKRLQSAEAELSELSSEYGSTTQEPGVDDINDMLIGTEEEVEIDYDATTEEQWGGDYYNKIMNEVVTGRSELASWIGKASKLLTNKKIGDDTKARIKVKIAEAQAKLDEMTTKGRKEEADKQAKLREELDRLEAIKQEVVNELTVAKETIQKTKEATEHIQDLYQKRIGLKKQLEAANKSVWETWQEIDEVTQQLEDEIKTVEGFEESELVGDVDKSISAVGAAIEALGSKYKKFVRILKALKKKLEFLRDKITEYATVKQVAKYELGEVNKAITELEKGVAEELGLDWKKQKHKARDDKSYAYEDINRLTKKTDEVKAKMKGVEYTKEILDTSKKGIGAKKTAKTSIKDDKGKLILAEEQTPLDMGVVFVTGKATTKLGSTELSNERLDELGVDKDTIIGQLPELDKNTDEKLAKYPYLMLLLDNSGKVNNNVVTAMQVAMDGYIARNLSTLTQVTVKDLSSLYGIDKDNASNYMHLLGEGIPRSLIAKRVANDITQSLGLKANVIKNEEGEVVGNYKELVEKISLGLANSALQVAIDKGDLSLLEAGPGDRSVDTVILPGSKNPNNTPERIEQIRRDKNDEIQARIHAYENELGLGSTARKIKGTPTVRTIEDIDVKGNPYTKTAKRTAEGILAAEAMGWTPNMEIVDKLLGLGEDKLRNILGYTEDMPTDVTKNKEMSINGKNRQILDDIENLQLLQDAVKDGTVDEKIYFDWFVSKTGRSMIESKGGFDPQNTKLHRYAVYTDEMAGTVVKGETSEKLFKLGIAQGLGFDIDKSPIDSSVAFADKVLEGDTLGQIEKALNNGEKSVEIDGVEYTFKEPSHSLQAILEGNKYKKADGKPFDTVMTLEVDGLTNGFAHKMMQYLVTKDGATSTELSEDTIKWLNKIGVRKVDGEVTDLVDGLDKTASTEYRIVDAYLTLGGEIAEKDLVKSVVERHATASKKNKYAKPRADADLAQRFQTSDPKEAEAKAEKLNKVLPALSEKDENGMTVLLKAVRDLMKYPFMTWGYQAGFKAISANVAVELIDDVAQQVLDAKKGDPIIDYIESMGFELESLQTGLKEKMYNQIMTKDGKNSFESIFRANIQGLYGDAIQEVMESEFGGVMQINDMITQGSTVMYHMFSKLLADKFPDGMPIEDELDKVIKEELWDMFPAIPGPNSTDMENGTDWIPLYKKESVKGANNKYGPVQTYTGESGKDSYLNVTRKGIADAGVTAGVTSTQHRDGTGTTETMIRDLVLQVFDAYVIGVDQAHVAENANKDFLEQNLDREWTQLRAMELGLSRLISNIEKMGLNKQEFIAEINEKIGDEAVARAEGYGDVSGDYETAIRAKAPKIENTLKTLGEYREAADTRAEVAKENDLNSQQFVLSAEEGYTYEGNTKRLEGIIEDTKKKYGMKKTDADSVITNVKDTLADIDICI